MSSRKAQIEINQDILINYVYGKVSIEEENYIEDILFENDNYTIAMDKLLSFVIRQKVKIKTLRQLFRGHRVDSLVELEEEIEAIIFQHAQPKVTHSTHQDYKSYTFTKQGIIALPTFDILVLLGKRKFSYQRFCRVVLCCWVFITFTNLGSLNNHFFVSTNSIQSLEYKTEVSPSFLLWEMPWRG